ncbi:chemotaxis protein [Haloimpatiens sp. FM7330]|uniref:chemotaxis protein n=1 Tax=Haloimpatiens sp. FM7330 TaxID=3298610 RepID=UPI00363658B6
MGKTNILLKSGTGEVEVLEFVVSGKHYAINVIKTREIVKIEKYTKMTCNNPAVAGVSLLRDNIISLIDLKYVLDNESMKNIEKGKTALICEFNKTKVAFLVDEVLGIHRISWEQIEKTDDLMGDSLIIGNIKMKDKILMFLDFEKILVNIKEANGVCDKANNDVNYDAGRNKYKIALADDSYTIRAMLKDALKESGYTNLSFFQNGHEVLEYLYDLKDKKGERFLENVDLLITDIEMPKMDGHTLTRKIKIDKELKKLPVVIFSSLITPELYHKGEEVGADAQISKPDIDKLVGILDELLERE